MIQLKKSNQRTAHSALAPIFEVLAFANGEYIPAAPYKNVRVYTRKGAAKPRLDRLCRGQAR